MTAMNVDAELLGRLAGPGPRYTSYPTAPEWTEDVGAETAHSTYRKASGSSDPISLYVHLPFCSRLCLYCGCTVEISGKQSRADRYLDAVEREIELVAADLGERRQVVQMHWGGGTPTFLSVAQLRRLHGMLAAAFELGGEQSIEVDPHVTTPEQTDLLFDLGFNRVSMGVQDVDPHGAERSSTAIRRYEETTATGRALPCARRSMVSTST